MTKKFSLLQLFTIVDGRLSTNMDDVYDIINHITNDNLMTHHLPVAFNYLKEKNPKWFSDAEKRLKAIASVEFNSLDPQAVQFESLINKIKQKYNDIVEVPQLKDEFDTSDFGDFMVGNSLLLKRFGNDSKVERKIPTTEQLFNFVTDRIYSMPKNNQRSIIIEPMAGDYIGDVKEAVSVYAKEHNRTIQFQFNSKKYICGIDGYVTETN